MNKMSDIKKETLINLEQMTIKQLVSIKLIIDNKIDICANIGFQKYIKDKNISEKSWCFNVDKSSFMEGFKIGLIYSSGRITINDTAIRFEPEQNEYGPAWLAGFMCATEK